MQDATLRTHASPPKTKANPRDLWNTDFLHLGVGFLFGENAELFDKNKVWQSFERDGVPIHTLQAQWGFLTLTQTAFAERRPDEKGMVHLRSCSRISIGRVRHELCVFCREFLAYSRYLCVGRKKFARGSIFRLSAAADLGDRARTDLRRRRHANERRGRGGCAQTVVRVGLSWVAEGKNIRNLLRCDLNVPPSGKAALEVTVPYEVFDFYVDEEDRSAAEIRKGWRFTRSDLPTLRQSDFDEARAACRARWEAYLAGGLFQTPERTVNAYVRTALINGLQMLAEEPGKPWLTCGQGGFYPRKFIWSVELEQLLTQLDRFGYHDEIRRALDYFMTTQDGSKGPIGKISSPEGSFAPYVGWMAETGTVLSMVWQHNLCAPDKAWLASVAPRILKGAEFIAANGTPQKSCGTGSRSRITD
jgi:hypothetical protein